MFLAVIAFPILDVTTAAAEESCISLSDQKNSTTENDVDLSHVGECAMLLTTTRDELIVLNLFSVDKLAPCGTQSVSQSIDEMAHRSDTCGFIVRYL